MESMHSKKKFETLNTFSTTDVIILLIILLLLILTF